MKVGDKVTWRSQALGCWTEKSGTFIAKIPSGTSAMQYVPETAKKSHIKFKDISEVDRVLVAVPAGKDNRLTHYYAPTEEEIAEYKRQKHEEFLKSFSDEEKLQRMKPKAVVLMRGVRYGLCPKCEHCLIECDSYCDECFQRIDWKNGGDI